MSLSSPSRRGGRREDARLVSGHGTYADDTNLPNQAYAAFVRSVIPHGVLRSVDLAAARALPGVLGIFTGTDLVEAGVGPIPYLAMPNFPLAVRARAPRPALAVDRVRHVGECIALIVADTPARAADAAELVWPDIDPLSAVTEVEAAIAPGAPEIWPDAPGNVALHWHGGDPASTDAAFARAAHITRLRLVNNRVVANPIEPRACLAAYDATTETFSLIAATQGVQYMLRVLCEHVFHVPRERMHVRTFDVGGAFGVKEQQPYPEDVAILHAARALGRPVFAVLDPHRHRLHRPADRQFVDAGDGRAARLLRVRHV